MSAVLSAWQRSWGGLSRRERKWYGVIVIGGFALIVAVWAALYSVGLGWFNSRDFQHFYYAGEAVRNGSDIYLSHTRGYIYPPLFALVMAPFSLLTFSGAAIAWTIFNAFLLVTAARLLATEVCVRFAVRSDAWTAWFVASVATLAIADKSRAVLSNGQSDALTMVLIALGFRSERSRPFWCGVCLGLACNIKYHTLVFLFYFVLRRRWREAAGMVVGVAAGAMAGVPVWGWTVNTDYLQRAVRGITDMLHIQRDFGPEVAVHSLAWTQSVSITSGFARMIGHLDHTALFLAAIGGVVAGCFALGWWMMHRSGFALFRGRGGSDRERSGTTSMIVALEWAGLMAATAVFSPQTTGRHFYLMTFVATMAAPAVLFPRAGVRRWPFVLAWVVMYLGMILPPVTDETADELRTWRHIGGMGWCCLLYFFAMLWMMLSWLKTRVPAQATSPGAART